MNKEVPQSPQETPKLPKRRLIFHNRMTKSDHQVVPDIGGRDIWVEKKPKSARTNADVGNESVFDL